MIADKIMHLNKEKKKKQENVIQFPVLDKMKKNEAIRQNKPIFYFMNKKK